MAQDRTNISIRRANEDDAEAIATVLHQSFVEYEPMYTREGFSATVLGSYQIRQRMKEGPVWVALLGEDVVGTVSAVSKAEAVYIRGMAIVPAARGLQIGQLLLKQIEDFAREAGHRRLFLSTTPFLTRAIRLYESQGFARSSEGPDNLFGTPLFTMEKILSPASYKEDG